MFRIITALILLTSLTGCAESVRQKESDQKAPPPSSETVSAPVRLSGEITRPADGDTFTAGEDIVIEFTLNEGASEVVSVDMKIDGREALFSGDVPGELVWNSGGQPVGLRQLRVLLTFSDNTTETYPLGIVLRSDIVPTRYRYRIVNSFPHDIKAFTQGIVFHDGYFYESTGQYGQSTLRKVYPETGEVLRSLNLDRELFGEGLAVHDGKLYQLTWKSGVGFIYDIETFRLLRRIHYPTEGWGLTGDGINLLKSDGSHYIYVLEPQHFTEIDRFEVFDNKEKVKGLNELEYIDGTIYANVFGTDKIVMIEHGSGRVTGIIDLTGLLDPRYHHPNLDVLNGIAYDHENDRLFVTGKNWPRMFEIELVPQ